MPYPDRPPGDLKVRLVDGHLILTTPLTSFFVPADRWHEIEAAVRELIPKET